jgi:hypothetical protein
VRWLNHKTSLIALTFVILSALAPRIWGQSDGIVDVTPQAEAAGRAMPALKAQSAGQADVALLGYYLGGNGQPLISTSGIALNLKEFLPGIGLFHASIEGYGGGGFHTGTNFLALEQAPGFGWHWDIVGGDSQFSANPIPNPFTNIYTPEISTRGIRVAMKRKDRSFQFFFGEETLLGGPRIPYRLKMPQQVLGGMIQQNVGKHWQFGLRVVHLTTNPSALAVNNTGFNFFIPGHEFESSNNLAVQSSYSFSQHVKVFSEAGYGRASTFTPSPVPQEPFSLLAGASWETDRFTLRGNYVLQSTTYMPLLGYFAGDRKGPFAEGHYRVNRKIELYGSASAYSNNLENNPDLPAFRSSSVTGGASFVLPKKFNASGSISTLHLVAREPAQPSEYYSYNRQLDFSLSRPVGRHNLRFSLIDMKLNSNFLPQTQRFEEIGDNFTWKHFVLGGAIRFQGSQSTESKNSLFFRGSIQANLKRLSFYANFEKGNDLANKTVFSMNAYNSTVIGVSSPLARGWNLQIDTYRNSLNTALNPLNIFLFPTAGLGLTQLPGFNQWSVYFRVGKQFHWGSGELASSGGIDQYVASRVPLVGSVQGLLIEQSIAGPRPAANVTISLDHYRNAITDASGHYEFSDVPEGSHEVGLNMEELPTDYEPGTVASTHVVVEPRLLVRSDFTVTRLTSLTGQIMTPGGVPIENVVIRLANTNRYTTPDSDGNFAFYNLREGNYAVSIDEQTLPDDVLLASPNDLPVLASSVNPPASLVFVLKIKPEAEKPVRRILREQIRVGGSARNGQGDDAAKPGSGAKRSRAGATTSGSASKRDDGTSTKSSGGSASKTDTPATGASHGGVGQGQ